MIDPSKTILTPSEIEQAQRIFDAVWPELASEKGEGNIRFPKKLYWLNGAPGAGKGTQTRFIMNLKSIEAAPVVVSDLLTTPEMQQLKDAGIMVGDKEVVALLLRKILEFSGKEGLIIDGFPRTGVQVAFLEMLHAKLAEIDSAAPEFHIIVLYVDEKISVDRQIFRGNQIKKANEEATKSGNLDAVEELRVTDQDPEAARKRYLTYKDVTFPALETLKGKFPYHFINAQESIDQVQANITREMA
ncbi:MAG: nucleoside monophosphate kinase [Opitutales bacterium]|nr:nucleoside monophosphate kinase [Opitutales bacterium]